MKTRLFVLTLFWISGLLNAVQVQVPLPGLCGNYTGGAAPVSLNFNCGTTFKQIDHAYILCSGSINPGLGMGDGLTKPPGFYPVDGQFNFYLPSQPYGWFTSAGLSGPFTEQVSFQSLPGGTLSFLMDGQAQINASVVSLIYIGVNTIYPPTGSITSASLIIDGITDWLAIESPRYFDTYVAGSMQSVVWLDYRAPAVPPRLYNIDFSSDDGQNWTPLNIAPVEISSFEWQVPDVNSQQCRIRVTEAADPNNAALSPQFTAFICNMELAFDIGPSPDCYVNLDDFRCFSENWLMPEGFTVPDLMEFIDAWLDCGNPYDPLCL